MTDGGVVDRVDLSRILVATDFAPRVEKAIACAVQVADEHAAALTIVHLLTVAAGVKLGHRQVARQASAAKAAAASRDGRIRCTLDIILVLQFEF